MSEKYRNVFKLLRLIGKKPNYGVDYFYIQDNDRLAIIDLRKLPKLRSRIEPLEKSERAYLYIDLFNPSNLRYIGFNVEKESGDVSGDVEGEIAFTSAEEEIAEFLETNLIELSGLDQPFLKLMEEEDKKPNLVGANTYPPRSNYEPSKRHDTHQYHNSNNFNYGSSSYKEREAFTDKLYLFVKNGWTSQAIDFIDEFMAEKLVSEKPEDVELISSILRWVSLEKIDFFSARRLLSLTSEKYTGRAELTTKYKTAFLNTQPHRIPDERIQRTIAGA